MLAANLRRGGVMKLKIATLFSLPAGVLLLALATGCARREDTAGPRPVEALPTPPARLSDGIRYRLAQPGRVSLAVYDAGGVLVRELLHAIPQDAGDHAVMWDGLDAAWQGVPAGEYTWRLL